MLLQNNNALEFRCIGPHRGGRVVAVAGDPRDAMTFYFGACAGGVWKTTDGGTNWDCISDGYFNTSAVGAIQVSDSDPNVIYVGMGETCIRGNVSHGDGVYKSTDAGKTWANVGLTDTRHIAKIRIHPQNPDWVYVAALGHTYGPNKERGVFRSTDGGKSWVQILFRSERAGAIDLSLDPKNPRILYAATWDVQRHPHKLVSGGEGSALYKSTDGGDTWVELSNNPGLPSGIKGKMGIALSPAQTDRVWALIEAREGGLYRSDDGGAKWEMVCPDEALRGRPWYYMHLFADPADPETVWALDYDALKSTDGGKNFLPVPTPHGDNHDLWIDPRDPRRMIEGNDGGACVSFNGGKTWSTLYNQPTAQIYHAITDDQILYRIYGSQQDNTAISLPNISTRGAITATEWFEPGGGESGYIAVKPDDPSIVVGGAIGSGAANGRLILYDRRTDQERVITVWPEQTGMGVGPLELKYRFQWTYPIFFSRHDANTLYISGNRVFRSRDLGTSWEIVSPDLSRNEGEKLQPSGGPITLDNTGAEVYCTIFALAESPLERDVLWAGTDDGLIHLSRDAGKSWTNITPPANILPEWALVSVIEPSSHDKATAYVAATRYKHDDFRPYLLKTNDYGKSWQTITQGIPGVDFTRTIRSDPARRGLLYAGTETAVYVSFDDGANWQRLESNLPVTPIYDLIVKESDLIVATHGRSFWMLDDVTPLRQWADETAKSNAFLFTPRATTRWRIYKGFGGKPSAGMNYRMAGPVVVSYRVGETPEGGKRERLLDAGDNPPDGVIVSYYLKERPANDITLTFMDAKGTVIKSFSSNEPLVNEEKKESEKPEPRLPKNAGLNRFAWNLHYPDAEKLPGDKPTEELLAGPIAAPGTYQVKLQVGEQSLTQSFELRPDPRVKAKTEDLQAQFELWMKIRDRLSATHSAVKQIRRVRSQIEEWENRAVASQNARAAEITASAKGIKDALTQVEEALVQTKAKTARSALPSKLNLRLAALVDAVASADAAPTKQQYQVYDDLSARIETQLARLRQTLEKDLAGFTEMLNKAGVPAIHG